jgi:hypothetical protein
MFYVSAKSWLTMSGLLLLMMLLLGMMAMMVMSSPPGSDPGLSLQ